MGYLVTRSIYFLLTVLVILLLIISIKKTIKGETVRPILKLILKNNFIDGVMISVIFFHNKNNFFY